MIEVKCSDHSAREAAHEILKYSEILRSQQQQIGESEFRCVLVSTHWHELHRPFSDYATRHHDVVGYRAEPTVSGEGWSLTRVDPLPRSVTVQLTSAHLVFLYAGSAQRHGDFAQISTALTDFGAPHHIGILIQNDVHRLMYPYGIYLVCGTADGQHPESARTEELADYPRDPLENHILDNFLPDHHADDIEQGSPEKLSYLLSTGDGWHATGVVKAGAFDRRDGLDVDDLLVRAAIEMPGFTSTAFSRFSSPSRRAHWAVTRDLALAGMPISPECREVVGRWLDHIEQTYGEHIVGVRINNPGIIRALVEIPPEDLIESPMSLRVAVRDPQSERLVTGVVVELFWDGTTVVDDLIAVIEDRCRSPRHGWGICARPSSTAIGCSGSSRPLMVMRRSGNSCWPASSSRPASSTACGSWMRPGCRRRPARPGNGTLVRSLGRHIKEWLPAPTGRLFVSRRRPGGIHVAVKNRPAARNAISSAWSKAQASALTPDEQALPLAATPYDLRHACVSFQLSRGISPALVAKWAGCSIKFLLEIYPSWIFSEEEAAMERLEAGYKTFPDG